MKEPMPRNISFALTTAYFRDRTKTVTRRMGWKNLRVGDVLSAVVQSQGLKKGEKVERLGLISVSRVQCERLDRLTSDLDYGFNECALEGFRQPHPMAWPSGFVEHFCKSHRGCEPDSIITRIEYEYL